MRFPAVTLVTGILVLLLTPLQATSQSGSPSSGMGHDGARFEGVLQRLDEEGQLVINREGQRRVIQAGQLVYWGKLADAREGAWLLTNQGSRIVANLTAWSEGQVRVESRAWQPGTIPVSSLRAVILQLPASVARQDSLLHRVQKHAGEDDLVFLQGGDILRGGMLGMSPNKEILPVIRIRIAGRAEDVRVPLSRVQAIAFRRAPSETRGNTGAHWVVGFRDGSRLAVESLAQQENAIRCQLEEGLELVRRPARAGQAWQDVVYLRPLDNGTVYLSDREPLGYKHLPFLEASWPYHMDRSVTGGRLAVAGVAYEKGIGMHSTSRLAFEVPENAGSFQAEIALDDSAGRRGSVVFLVYCQKAVEEENSGGWEALFQSEVVRAGQLPQQVRVPLEGIRRLALLVQHADRGDVRDHANWLHARFTIKPVQ